MNEFNIKKEGVCSEMLKLIVYIIRYRLRSFGSRTRITIDKSLL
jgi:hypothetical protein